MESSHGAYANLPDKADILKAKIRQLVVRLFKSQLSLQEQWIDDHDAAMIKLIEALPPEYKGYVKLADYLPEHRTENSRKKTLDEGNSVIRELEELVDNLRIK